MKFPRLPSAQRNAFHFSLSFLAVYAFLVLFPSACGNRISTLNGPLPPHPVNNNGNKGATPTPNPADPVIVSDKSCDAFVASLPKDFTHDRVTVPEDYDHPETKKLSVFYYGKINKASIPILFLNSGPARDSQGAYKRILNYLTDMGVQDQYSFIFMDPRGNGCSGYYPQGSDADTLQKLTFYGSKQLVSDAETIRKKLINDKPWIVFGQGYGALVAHRYVTDAPKSVQAALAHGDTIIADGNSRAKNRLLAQKEVLSFYFSQYKDDEKLLKSLVAQLKPEVCFTSDPTPATGAPPAATNDPKGVKANATKTKPATPQPKAENKKAADPAAPTEQICGVAVISHILPNLLGDTTQWSAIHGRIGRMMEGDALNQDQIQSFLKKYYFGKSNPLNKKWLAREVIESMDLGLHPLDFYHCDLLKKDLEKDGVYTADDIQINECMSALQNPKANQTDTTPQLPKSTMSPLDLATFKNALTGNSKINFYLYSGENDPTLPPVMFDEETKALEGVNNFKYRAFSGSGTEGFIGEAKIWADLDAEIAAVKPAAPNSTSTAAPTTPPNTPGQLPEQVD